MTQRKAKHQTDVYFYIKLAPDDTDNCEFKINILLRHYKSKKSLRVSGIYIDYCEDTVNIENRNNYLNMLRMLQNTTYSGKVKFIVCCWSKNEISNNAEQVSVFENSINQLGGIVHFNLEAIGQNNQKNNTKMIEKYKIMS